MVLKADSNYKIHFDRIQDMQSGEYDNVSSKSFNIELNEKDEENNNMSGGQHR
jgi:hypothetical protein